MASLATGLWQYEVAVVDGDAITIRNIVLAGIYGMNFEHMPELHSEWGYFVALGAMSGIVILMVVLFLRWGRIGSRGA